MDAGENGPAADRHQPVAQKANDPIARVRFRGEVEDWAGPVCDKPRAAEKLGLSMDALEDLLKSGAAIGFDVEDRGFLIPEQQLDTGKVLRGISEVMSVCGIPKQCWVWLRTGNGRFDGAPPIEILREGRVVEVLAQAKYDFCDW